MNIHFLKLISMEGVLLCVLRIFYLASHNFRSFFYVDEKSRGFCVAERDIYSVYG